MAKRRTPARTTTRTKRTRPTRAPRKGARTPAEKRRWLAARRGGADAALAALARRTRRLGIASAEPRGVLLAEGDSWFSYPMTDVLDALEDRHGWEVVSVARPGDRVESMAYDQKQVEKRERALRKLTDAPKAILLSGGGNDIAGNEFAMLLDHKESTLPVLNAHVVTGVLEERLMTAYNRLIGGLTTLCEQLFQKRIPIFLHGYARPVPDGRGFLGGLLLLPGPWLAPGFGQKGFTEKDLATTTQAMGDLIDAFNAQLARLAGSKGLEHVHFVDVRKALSNQLPRAYRADWANELHPTDSGFERVAALIDDQLP
jgi:lysophospholipase L1-like esterase